MKLDERYNKEKDKIKLFKALTDCRHMDHPNNLNDICFINLKMFNAYCINNIFDNIDYTIKRDYNLVTLIYNYLASLKSYLNKKLKFIKNKIPKPYKKQALKIFYKFWDVYNNKTQKSLIDKLIKIRNRIEHIDLTSGIKRKVMFNETSMITKIYIDDTDIIDAFNKSFEMLNSLNEELEKFLNENIQRMKIRDTFLFMNAYNRFNHLTRYTLLLPEETEEEIKYYDNIINQLIS
ncbi:MAG: hypothetical protein HFI85_04815 [Clostridia bacterium]|jgi:hypothetical protein|nr:hypothetical protein [Clostridia bacterium]